MTGKLRRVVAVTGLLIIGVMTANGTSAQADPAASDYKQEDLRRLPKISRSGEVTKVHSREYFEMRSNRNDEYRVLVDNKDNAPWLKKGDKVDVSGRLDRDVIIASDVNKSDGDDDDDDNRTNITGQVTERYTNGHFMIRYNNRDVTVYVNRNDAQDYREGMRVRATGKWRNQVFAADDVRILDGGDGDGDNDWQNGNVVTINARLTSGVDNNKFDARADNGKTFNVMAFAKLPGRLGRGDKVKITGRWNKAGNQFNATSVQRTDDDDDDNNGSQADFKGKVTDITSSRRILVQSDDSRKTFIVNTQRNLDRDISKGDRVRVKGRSKGSIVSDAEVELTGRDDSNDFHVKGVVTQIPGRGNRYFTVRKSDGTEYKVSSENGGKLDKGDKVYVEGKRRGDVIFASEIRKL